MLEHELGLFNNLDDDCTQKVFKEKLRSLFALFLIFLLDKSYLSRVLCGLGYLAPRLAYTLNVAF